MKTVSPAQVESGNENTNPAELALPPSVQVALGELVNAAKDGLLALSVGVGLGVLHELMEVEVVRGAVGSGGARDPASGLSQQPEEAEGSPDPEPRAEGGKQP